MCVCECTRVWLGLGLASLLTLGRKCLSVEESARACARVRIQEKYGNHGQACLWRRRSWHRNGLPTCRYLERGSTSRHRQTRKSYHIPLAAARAAALTAAALASARAAALAPTPTSALAAAALAACGPALERRWIRFQVYRRRGEKNHHRHASFYHGVDKQGAVSAQAHTRVSVRIMDLVTLALTNGVCGVCGVCGMCVVKKT